ncbi:hypothetical protein OG21DRAFT_1508682 [Imleria badia]|nr:hypothetical protein OG21DRAFT_1508682 [Imleria badia]
MKEVFKEEVAELMTPTESEDSQSGYGKIAAHVIVSLKTVQGAKQVRPNPTILIRNHPQAMSFLSRRTPELSK